MRGVMVGVVGSMALLAACGWFGGSNSKEVIQQAIEAHLKEDSHLSLQNFSTEIESVKFQGDTAQALVRYQSKESPELAVQVNYVLKKNGDRWEVISSSPAGGQGVHSHGAMGSESAPSASSTPQAPLAPEASH